MAGSPVQWHGTTPADDGLDGSRGERLDPAQRVHDAGVSATEKDHGAGPRLDEHRLVVVEWVRLASLRVQEEGPRFALELGEPRDRAGEPHPAAQRERHPRGPEGPALRESLAGRGRHADLAGLAVAPGVARRLRFGLRVHRHAPSSRESRGQPARVIVVPVAEHDCVGAVQGDPERVGVVGESQALSGVEQDEVAARLDPQRQSVLGQQPAPPGHVVRQDHDPHRPHLLVRPAASAEEPTGVTSVPVRGPPPGHDSEPRARGLPPRSLGQVAVLSPLVRLGDHRSCRRVAFLRLCARREAQPCVAGRRSPDPGPTLAEAVTWGLRVRPRWHEGC